MKMLIEGLAELSVPVMDQESKVDPFFLSPQVNIPCLLPHPFIRGI
jgi:hypothetical protein